MFRRLLALLLAACIATGCAVISLPIGLTRTPEMHEFTVKSADSWFTLDKILLLDLSGVISAESSGGLFGSTTNMLDDIQDALKFARKDKYIKAVILRINSPGGEVTASDIIYEQIRQFRQDLAKNNRPVVIYASILGEGASGAYYIAMAADKVYAHPTSITGAIGVVSSFPNLSGLAGKLGVQMRVIKSADKKDIGSMWREFLPDERAILQSTIDEMYQRFVTIVDDNRKNLDRDAVLKLADGRIYTARQALNAGLIDAIAYLDEVVKDAKQQAGITDAHIITYRRAAKFSGGLYSRANPAVPQSAPEVNVVQINAGDLLPLRKPGFYYLWLP
jgi:protease-4